MSILTRRATAMKKFRELEPGYSIEIAAKTEPFKYPQDLDTANLR